MPSFELSPEERANLPRSVAVILDGNGRWATSRGLSRSEGHVQGAKTVGTIVEECARLGLERLTLYCFSSENWKRPQSEVDALMELLRSFMIERREELVANNIRLRVVGRRSGIPQSALDAMDETIRLTANNTGLTLSLAINYGSRAEIVDAAKSIVEELSDPKRRDAAFQRTGARTLDELLTEEYFAAQLYDGQEARDPDLLIRPGGEKRLSNYLLWQLSYAELYFCDALWPDFTVEDLYAAFAWYATRRRRFGAAQ